MAGQGNRAGLLVWGGAGKGPGTEREGRGEGGESAWGRGERGHFNKALDVIRCFWF